MSVDIRNPEYTCDLCGTKEVSSFSSYTPKEWNEYLIYKKHNDATNVFIERFHVCKKCDTRGRTESESSFFGLLWKKFKPPQESKG